MNKIILNKIDVQQKKIIYNYSIEGNLKKYFKNKNKYSIKYEYDLSSVPIGILAIPFVANVLPIVWLFNAELYIDSLDYNFYESIDEIKKAYIKMYPQLEFLGKIIVNNKEKNYYSGTKKGLFFSGGLDATSTLITHYEEKPLLINIQGSDLSTYYKKVLKKVKAYLSNVAKDFNLDITFIKSEFRTIIKEKVVTKYFYEQVKDNYWHGFQHGIAIISHAAPIAYIEKLDLIYIAASYTKESLVPCASDPTIDNRVILSNTKIFHDGFELDRNAKSQNVVNFINNYNKKIKLRVCYEDYRVENCCSCEKCYRTIMNFCAKDFDVKKVGFNLTEKNFKKMENDLKNRIIFTTSDKAYWTTIQNEFNLHPNLKKDIRFAWIYDLDLNNINNKKIKKIKTFIYKNVRRIKKIVILIMNVLGSDNDD